MKISTALRLTAATAAVAALVVPTAAASATPPKIAASANVAVVRAAHFSPDTPGVDVYLTSFSGHKQTLWHNDLGYGDVSGYQRIPAGNYLVSMRAHGASPSTPAGLSWNFTAKPGQAFTVAAVGTNNHLTGTVLPDTLRSPAKGHGLVRVIQAASRAPSAKLVANNRIVLAADARFPTATSYAAVPAGTWKVTAQSGPLATSKVVAVQPGAVDSILVLDAQGSGITLRALQDASAPATTPRGAIDTGAGGTAAESGNLLRVYGASFGVLALGALALVARRRRAVAAA